MMRGNLRGGWDVLMNMPSLQSHGGGFHKEAGQWILVVAQFRFTIMPVSTLEA